MKTLFLCSVVSLCAAGALADVRVMFDEGAPKDRFTFTNIGDCAVPASTLALDLTGSAGKLVFDVTEQGAGVEVFQPFELVSGKAYVIGTSAVKDGDKSLSLSITGLAKGDSVAFTIDVDDTLGAREITVTKEEIDGAMATVQIGTAVVQGIFEGRSVVVKTVCDS